VTDDKNDDGVNVPQGAHVYTCGVAGSNWKTDLVVARFWQIESQVFDRWF
jgi:hypothetical protein